MKTWVWWSFGLLSLALEVTQPGSFVFVFFSVAAMVMGALLYMLPEMSIGFQSLAFVTLATLSMLIFRARLLRWFQMRRNKSDHAAFSVPDMALAAEDILPGEVGQVQLHGTVWRGRNMGTTPLKAGLTYRVVGTENITVLLMDRGVKGEML